MKNISVAAFFGFIFIFINDSMLLYADLMQHDAQSKPIETSNTAQESGIHKGEIPQQIPNAKLESALRDKELVFDEEPAKDRARTIDASRVDSYGNFFTNVLDATGTTLHEANYLLPYSYAFSDRPEGEQRTEAKFQLSFKTPILRRIASMPLNLYFAYTQRSFWQLYDSPNSRPFRENNYQPELFLNYETGLPFYYINIGYMHESNGGGIERSRGWDRLMLAMGFKYKNTNVRFRAWYRFEEPLKTHPNDTRGDDNPDIIEYLGDSEFVIEQKLNKHIVSFTFRPVIVSDAKGFAMLDYAYPMSQDLYWYTQFFVGYGESLYDYNRYVRRLGFGFRLYL